MEEKKNKIKGKESNNKMLADRKLVIAWLVLSVLIMIGMITWLTFVLLNKDDYSNSWYVASVAISSLFIAISVAVVGVNVYTLKQLKSNKE